MDEHCSLSTAVFAQAWLGALPPMEKDSNHDVSHVVGLYHSFSVAHKTPNRTEGIHLLEDG